MTSLGEYIVAQINKWQQQQKDEQIIQSLIALNDDQWDFIISDQDVRCWCGGLYYGIECTEYHIYFAFCEKFVKTGLREPLL